MKMMKKLASVLLAVTLMVMPWITTAAAETANGSITIENAPHVSVNGKTFKAYKLLDATFTADGNNAAYTVPESMKAVYKDVYGTKVPDPSAADFGKKVVAKVLDDTKSPEQAFAFGKLMAGKLSAADVKQATGENGVVKFDDLPLGYYLVAEAGRADENIPVSAVILTNAKAVNITLKADLPSVEKKIDGANDTDPSTDGPVNTNNASIGDEVPYVITSHVPDMDGYSRYFFIVTDTLAKGLTYSGDAGLRVEVGETCLRQGTDYTVTSSADEADGTVIRIVFADFYNRYKAQTGAEITITYTAKLNGDAVIGSAGNPNRVFLTYSDDPNREPQGIDEPTDGEREAVTGDTVEALTRTYVTGLQLLKQDDSKKALGGARFEIKGTRLNQVVRVETEFIPDPVRGTYYKLTDGSYTRTAPTDTTEDQYASCREKYAIREKTMARRVPETMAAEAEVDPQAGVLRIDGLAAGQYTITETKAPDGYNKLMDPIRLTVHCDNGQESAEWTVTGDAQVQDGIILLTVENTTGSVLPSTGDIGTRVFYVIGAASMIAALAILIAKKRMDEKD